MKIIMIFFLATMLLAPYSAPGSGARPKSKPLSPIKIEIITADKNATADNISGGDIVDFNVVVSSYTDITSAIVKIIPSKQLELISGSVEWEGPLKKGEDKVIPITVRIPQVKKGKIRAKVIFHASGGTQFSSSAKFSLGGVKKKPKSTPLKKDGRGRDIMEDRL